MPDQTTSTTVPGGTFVVHAGGVTLFATAPASADRAVPGVAAFRLAAAPAGPAR